MSLYYVRHGETDWNKLGKLQGTSDIPLNATGRKQASITKEKLKGVTIHKIYCSPLQRAKETAAILNRVTQVEIIEDDRIIERCFGEWEGTCLKKTQFDMLWEVEQNLTTKNLEGMVPFFDRVYRFLAEIEAEAQSQNILIVAHGGVFLPCYCYFHPEKKEGNLKDILIPNCALVTLNCEGN